MVTVLLYILAIALPLFGFSVLGLIVRFFSNARLKAKTRIHNANIKTSEREINSGELCLPSWGTNKQKALLFIETIQQLAMRQGVPRVFLLGLLSDLDGTRAIFLFAGAMENSGASFLEQQAACADKLVGTFKNTSMGGRQEAIEKGKRAMAKIANDEIPF